MKQSRVTHRKTTRKQFLIEVAGVASAVPALAAQANPAAPKILSVVAHPDDEYAFAAFAYRLTHELKGAMDQIVITNGEAGFRYSQLAAAYYGLPLSDESVGRDRLPAIRRQEAERAGRILGIRQHCFLEQRDARFTLDSREAFSGIWDTEYVAHSITARLRQQRYDFVVVMLPTAETHGHHQAAALLALEAIQRLPAAERPVLLAAEPSGAEAPVFRARSDHSALRAKAPAPEWRVNRLDTIPEQSSLTYNVVVNWVIAEHKSQGLFQTDAGRHSFENFWLFETDTPEATKRAANLFDSLDHIRSSRQNHMCIAARP